jgi:alpha-L-rhamnosidase
METKADENGLYHYGLGDWLPVQQDVLDPVYLTHTDTIMCKDICDKAALIFDVIGDSASAEYARCRSRAIKAAFRTHCMSIYPPTGQATLNVQIRQTIHAMAIYYGMYESHELDFAIRNLELRIRMCDYHMDVGVLGARVIFHVLAEHGRIETSMKMILNPTFPSYKFWLSQGATTLFESFICTSHPVDQLTADDPWVNSLNHHFWGDIIGFFIRHLAGIQVEHHDRLTIAPNFIESINNVSAYTDLPGGRVTVGYKKTHIMVEMTVSVPKNTEAKMKVPCGYELSFGKSLLKHGEHHLIFCKKQ